MRLASPRPHRSYQKHRHDPPALRSVRLDLAPAVELLVGTRQGVFRQNSAEAVHRLEGLASMRVDSMKTGGHDATVLWRSSGINALTRNE